MTRSASSELAVSMMIGTCAWRGCWRTQRQRLKPSSSGSITSRITRSLGASFIAWRKPAPSGTATHLETGAGQVGFQQLAYFLVVIDQQIDLLTELTGRPCC
jgi:hypothetical protein